MKNFIIVLIKAPNQEPLVKTIPNNLRSLQGIVDGHIEVVDVRKNVIVICNEEAKMLKVDREDPIMGGCLLTEGGAIVHERFKAA